MCWESTSGSSGETPSEGGGKGRYLALLVAWEIARQQIGWAGLHSRSIAWFEGEGDGSLSTQHLESSGIGGLEAAFALRVRPRTGAWGRQRLDEAGQAEHERGMSDNSMSEEKRSMSEEEGQLHQPGEL
jgi:hypothetical protein